MKNLYYYDTPINKGVQWRALSRIKRRRNSRCYKENKKSYFLICLMFLILGIVGLLRATTLG